MDGVPVRMQLGDGTLRTVGWVDAPEDIVDLLRAMADEFEVQIELEGTDDD